MGASSVVDPAARTRTSLLVACMLLLGPALASAQIYAWRDSKGTLVLSDKPIDAPTAVYEVAGAPAYRTTTPTETPVVEDSVDSLVIQHAQRHALRPER